MGGGKWLRGLEIEIFESGEWLMTASPQRGMKGKQRRVAAPSMAKGESSKLLT